MLTPEQELELINFIKALEQEGVEQEELERRALIKKQELIDANQDFQNPAVETAAPAAGELSLQDLVSQPANGSSESPRTSVRSQTRQSDIKRVPKKEKRTFYDTFFGDIEVDKNTMAERVINTFANTLPKAVTDLKYQGGAAKQKELQEEKQRLLNDGLPNDILVSFGGTMSPRTGVRIGEKTTTKGQRLQDIEKELISNQNNLLETLIKSKEYQDKIAEVGAIEVFNDDNSIKSFSQLMEENAIPKILGDQIPQMLVSIFTGSGSTFVQESGQAAIDIASRKAARKLGISMDEFYELPNEVQAQAMVDIVNLGEADIDKAMSIGGKSAGLELISNFVTLGGAKLIPKSFVRNAVRGDVLKTLKSVAVGTGKTIALPGAVETVTETGQSFVGLTGVEEAVNPGTFEKVKDYTDFIYNNRKEFYEVAAQSFIVPGPISFGGKVFKTGKREIMEQIASMDPESAQTISNGLAQEFEKQYEQEKNSIYERFGQGEIDEQTRDSLLEELNKKDESFYKELDVVKAYINSNKLRNLSGDRKKIVFEELQNLSEEEKNLEEIENKIQENGGEENVSFDLLNELLQQGKKVNNVKGQIYKQVALDNIDKHGEPLMDYINSDETGVFKGKTITVFNTNKEIEKFIENEFGKEGLNDPEVQNLLKGENNAIKKGRFGIISKENQEKNLDTGDLSAANSIHHEALHFIFDSFNEKELAALVAEIKSMTGLDKQTQKALDFARKRELEYREDGYKGKQLNEEFLTAYADGLKALQIKDLSLEQGQKFKKLADFVKNIFNKNTENALPLKNLNGTNFIQFVKKYNNFNKKTTLQERKAIIEKEGKGIAQKSLDRNILQEEANKYKAGTMPDELATRIALAYEPLAASIANKIYAKNFEGEQGYTKGEFEQDIAFGRPDEIGGANSLREIALSYDPEQGKSLGGWLKDIGTQRAKRIAEKRIGAQKTSDAKKLDAPESIQVAAEAAPEIVIDKPISEKINLPKGISDKVTNDIAQLAVLNIQNQLKKNPKASLKQKTTIKEKAAANIVNREIGKDIKNTIKNLGKDNQIDYISKNWKTVAEAFVDKKNINKIQNKETKDLLQSWKDGKATKESVLGYFNDPNIKSNTRSDRRNRALNDALVYLLTKDAVNKFAVANPDQAQQFQQQQGIPLALAQKAWVRDILVDADTADLFVDLSLDGANFKENLAKYIDDIKFFEKEFPNGMLSASMAFGVFGKEKDAAEISKLAEQNWNFAKKEINKIEFTEDKTYFETEEFGKTNLKKYGKTKPSQRYRIANKLAKDPEALVEDFRVFNAKNDQMGTVFWNKAAEIFSNEENNGYRNSFLHLLAGSVQERNHVHSLMAEIVYIEKDLINKLKKGTISSRETIWEHAVPNLYAARELINAIFNKEPNFATEILPAVKKQFKQGLLSKDNAKLIDNEYGKNEMRKGFNIKKDSYVERVNVIPNVANKVDYFGKDPNPFVSVAQKSLGTEFNRILEQVKGVPTRQKFSEATANILGKKNNPFKFFVPYSAEDYMGLIYPTLGKGKTGEKNLEWYKKNIITPYARGIRDFEIDKQVSLKAWENLKKQIKNTPAKLSKEGINNFTNENAIRIHLWSKQGVDAKDLGLKQKEIAAVNKYVKSKKELKDFANQIQSLTPDGYPDPTGTDWLAGTITTDLVNYTNTVSRKKYLEQWQNNVDVVYSKENINKLKAIYGDKYTEALQDMLYRMKTGRNRPTGGNRLSNLYLNWVNDSVGTIMFFNSRSALLQTLSALNYINFTDNNPIRIAATAANQKQFWADFSEIFNSDFLKSRRSGLKTDVNADEIARTAETSENKFRAGLSALLKKGFLPTQMADSFAISFGGASFYRNRIKTYLKQGLNEKEAKEKAFLDFKEVTEESQQSSRPDRVSLQQASSLGRLILAFANTPMQYTRLTKKAALDLINNRGDWKTNLSKLVYYGAVQNVIFTALQSAMFAMLFSDEDEDEKKKEAIGRIGNGIADTLLRGSGIAGAAVSAAKNIVLEVIDQAKGKKDFEKAAMEITSLSPPIDSKLAKLQSAGRAFKYKQNREKIRELGPASIENPAYMAAAQILSATANIPLDRALRKFENLKASVDSDTEMWQSIALALGYSKWDVGLIEKEREAEKLDKELKKANDALFEKLLKPKRKRRKKGEFKLDDLLQKGLPEGVLGRAYKDGTMQIKPGLPKEKRKKVVAHEKKHLQDIKNGILNYNNNFIFYKGKQYKRTPDKKVVYNGKKFPEGHSKLPWEAAANKAERKVS
jgi:hypothetical protein